MTYIYISYIRPLSEFICDFTSFIFTSQSRSDTTLLSPQLNGDHSIGENKRWSGIGSGTDFNGIVYGRHIRGRNVVRGWNVVG